MSVEIASPESSPETPSESPPPRSTYESRLPLVVFGVVVVIALPVLRHLGRARWFVNDDWFFLVAGSTHKFRTILLPNSWGHWITLPILAYRLFYWLFGLRHFGAYLLLVIVLHLATCTLLLAVMRRCGAGPWISTMAASTFVFFGPGADDIFEPVQMTFDGSLVFGLAHLLLADHEGGMDYRDFVGLAFGFLGLMCSNVSIAMVATVGIAVWWRRGWRAAAFHTVPLAVIFLAWWHAYARRPSRRLLANRASFGELLDFLWRGLHTTFEGLGHFPIVGLFLAVILVGGLAASWMHVAKRGPRRSGAAAALAVGSVIFIGSAGLVRAGASGAHNADYVSRYVYVSAAMMLPAVAIAATALARRWRVFGPIVMATFLVALPGNYHDLASNGANFPKNYRHRFLVLAHSPVTHQLPRWMRVPPLGYGWMNVGWMIAGVKSGRIPDPGPVSASDAATAALDLQLSPYVVSRTHGACRVVEGKTFVLETGDELIAASGNFSLVAITDQGAHSAPERVLFHRFQIHAGPVSLRVTHVIGHPPVLTRCEQPAATSRGAANVAVDKSGNVYVTVTTDGTLPGSPNRNQRGHDAFVAKYDTSGKRQ